MNGSTTTLSPVCMDHLGGLTFELQLTADLLQRGLFRDRIASGYQRLKEGRSRATEGLGSE